MAFSLYDITQAKEGLIRKRWLSLLRIFPVFAVVGPKNGRPCCAEALVAGRRGHRPSGSDLARDTCHVDTRLITLGGLQWELQPDHPTTSLRQLLQENLIKQVNTHRVCKKQLVHLQCIESFLNEFVFGDSPIAYYYAYLSKWIKILLFSYTTNEIIPYTTWLLIIPYTT